LSRNLRAAEDQTVQRSVPCRGKTWTGFANSEEKFADEYVGRRIQPFWVEEEAKKIPNTNFIVNGRFKSHAVRDGKLDHRAATILRRCRGAPAHRGPGGLGQELHHDSKRRIEELG
jgi:hypothetical protein